MKVLSKNKPNIHIFILEILFLSFFIFSCRLNKKSQEITAISFNPEIYKASFINEIFDTLNFIPLNTGTTAIIKSIDRIKATKTNIFIADFQQASLFVLDKQGNLKSIYTHKGVGKEEYSEMSDVYFSNNNYIVFDRQKLEIFYFNYNGIFLYSKKINEPQKSGYNFILCNGLYYFDRQNNNGNNLDKTNIGVYDSAHLSFKSSFIPIFNRIQNISFVPHKNMDIWNNSVYYIPSISNFIYAFNNGFGEKIYKLDVPQKYLLSNDEYIPMQNDQYDTSIIPLLQSKKIISKFDYFAINNDFVILGFYCPFYKTLIYSKSTKIAKIVDGFKYKTQVYTGTYPIQVLATEGDWFITTLSVSFLSFLKDNVNIIKKNEQNPVLIYFKLKRF